MIVVMPSDRARPAGSTAAALVERAVSGQLRTATRVGVSAAGFGAAVVLAGLDHVTGPGLSFDAFYVLAVLVVTLAGGLIVGMAAAALTAVVWAGSDALIRSLGLSIWADIWNGLVRFVALVIVVLLVTALVRTLAATRQSAQYSREFLAAAAHQLRTPVAALRTSVEALVHTDASPAQERLVGNAVKESARLGRLITSLLRVARLDQGELIEVRPVEVRPLLESEVTRMRELTALTFDLSVDPAVPASVLIDEAATCDALANVFDNAVRHASTRVTVEVTVDGDEVAVAVGDDGPGLPVGSERRAFERFVTLDGGGGSGLGLPIARALARGQGGDLVYRAKRFVLLLSAVVEGGRVPRT